MTTYKNHFKNLETFKKGIRTIKKDQWADWIKIGSDWYVIEEFDNEGKNLRLTSLTANKHIEINTSTRYSETWLSDAEIDIYEATVTGYRFYPDFYLLPADFLKLSPSQKSGVFEIMVKAFGRENVIEYMKAVFSTDRR